MNDVIEDLLSIPMCDKCNRAQDDSPLQFFQEESDWNGETGNHISCEENKYPDLYLGDIEDLLARLVYRTSTDEDNNGQIIIFTGLTVDDNGCVSKLVIEED